jgi:hypothetical protein
MILSEKDQLVAPSYARLFNDNPAHGDGKLILKDLAEHTGFFGTPDIRDWILRHGTAAGYEAALHQSNGARALFDRIRVLAGLNEDALLKIEQSIRFGYAEE